MITPLAESEGTSPTMERRATKRLVPTSGVILAKLTTSDGRTHNATVVDVTARGARLSGDLPGEVDDRVRVEIQLDPAAGPYTTAAVITHRDASGVGVRFTR